MSAKEILYKKCNEKGGCFLSGQVGWIVEAMEEYAQQDFGKDSAMEAKKISNGLFETIGNITKDYAKQHGINLK